MRVKGNISPPQVSVELLPFEKGFALVRLRDNIVRISETDESTGTEIDSYRYDEYAFTAKYYDSLQHDIEKDLSNWLATCRALELNEKASAVCDMRSALEILGVNTNED